MTSQPSRAMPAPPSLATLARTIGTDASFQAQLFESKNPAHASELLHGEESVDFNYFLEDDPQP